jgi:hypothetical protein
MKNGIRIVRRNEANVTYIFNKDSSLSLTLWTLRDKCVIDIWHITTDNRVIIDDIFTHIRLEWFTVHIESNVTSPITLAFYFCLFFVENFILCVFLVYIFGAWWLCNTASQPVIYILISGELCGEKENLCFNFNLSWLLIFFSVGCWSFGSIEEI